MQVTKVRDPYPYKIMWNSQYGREEVDETDTLQDAKSSWSDSLAFGEGRVYYKKCLYLQSVQ